MSRELELFPTERTSQSADFIAQYRTLQDLANTTMDVPSTKAFDNSSFNQGANNELRRLRDALNKGDVPKNWANEPITIPRMTYNQMIEYIDGADVIREYAGQMLAHGGKMDLNTILLNWKHAKHLRVNKQEREV